LRAAARLIEHKIARYVWVRPVIRPLSRLVSSLQQGVYGKALPVYAASVPIDGESAMRDFSQALLLI
jgi:hypothetical protein